VATVIVIAAKNISVNPQTTAGAGPSETNKAAAISFAFLWQRGSVQRI